MKPSGSCPAALYPLACALALLAIVATYANHFNNEFHFDDNHTIQNNLYIRDLRNLPLFFRSAATFSSLPANQSYRPVVTTTLAVDYRLGHGLRPLAFHITNFGLFAVQCAAMLWLYRRLLDRARPHALNRWVALFGVAWYGLHPANAETVNYIIARSEILSTLGVVCALLMFAAGGRSRRYGLYLIPAAAGILAKEQGAMFAPLLFLYVALFERDLSIRALLRPAAIAATLRATWPAFLVCGGVVAGSLRMASSFSPGGSSRWQYLLAQPFVMLHYTLTFFLPLNLSADTDWKPIANPFDDRVVVGVVFVACALAAAVVASRRRETRPAAFGVLWFFVALLPTSSVVPLAEVLNDHRVYFPFVGLTLAVVSAGWRVLDAQPSRQGAKRVAAALALIMLACFAFGTRQRNAVWRTEETLWLDVTRKSPENGRGLMTYGVIQMGKGNYAEADQYFARALQYTPRYAYLHVNIGVLKGALGDAAGAERHFREAQQYDAHNPISYMYYARWLGSVGRRDEALAEARRAVELSPADAEARALLQTLASQPVPPVIGTAMTAEQWLSVSLAHFQAGRYQECIDASLHAISLRPDYAEAFNNLCAADNALGQYAEAVAACERAVALKPGFQLALNNLAAARSKTTK